MKLNDSGSMKELDLRLRRATLASGSEKRSARDALLICTKTMFYLYARALLLSRNGSYQVKTTNNMVCFVSLSILNRFA